MKTDQLIVALDVEDLKEVRKIVSRISPPVQFYKVGLRLFTREGPPVVRWLKKKGFKVFLDLKFHDIPNTVAQAVESATRLGVDLLTIHALGGEEMMREAVKSAKSAARKFKIRGPQIFAVTILTSQVNLKPIGIDRSLPKEVVGLGQLAEKAGVDGLVCSPQELKALKKSLGRRLRFLTPGVRLDSQTSDDQKRIATPSQALSDGAHYLVVGRPILRSSHPKKVVQEILSSF